MSGADLTAYNDALIEVWTQDHTESQIYEKDPFLDQVEKTARYHIGAKASVPLLVSRNGGFSQVGSAGSAALNAAGSAGLDKAEYQYAYPYQQVRLEHSAIVQTDGKAVSVANAIDTEMQIATASLRKQITRQLFGNGDNIICACGTTSSSTTVVLDATDGADAIVRRWLPKDLTIDIGTSSDEDSIAAGVQITAVNKSTPSITITGSAVSTTSSNYVSIANSRSGSTALGPINGLKNIVSTSADLGGLSVSSQPEWQAASRDDSTTTFSLDWMYDQQEAVQQQTGEDFDLVLTSLKLRKQFYKQLQMQTRFDGDRSLGSGNTGGVEFAGMKIQAHVDCPSKHMWFLTTSDFLGLKTPRGAHWQSEFTGGKPLDWIQGSTAFGGVLMNPFQFGVKRRNSHAGGTALA